MIHHFQYLSNDLVVNAPHAADFFIQKPVPINFSVGNHLDHGLVEVEKFGDLLLIHLTPFGCDGLRHAHESTITQ